MLNYMGWEPAHFDPSKAPYQPDLLRMRIFKNLIDCLANLLKRNPTSRQETEKNDQISLYEIYLNILFLFNPVDFPLQRKITLITFFDTTPVLDTIKTINELLLTTPDLSKIINDPFWVYISTCESFKMWRDNPWRICPKLDLYLDKDRSQIKCICTHIHTPCPRALAATQDELRHLFLIKK